MQARTETTSGGNRASKFLKKRLLPRRAFFSLTRENEGFDSGDREICAGSIHARGNNVTYVGWDSQEGRFARVSSKKIKGE